MSEMPASWRGPCEKCGKVKERAYQPRSNPRKLICLGCYIQWLEERS